MEISIVTAGPNLSSYVKLIWSGHKHSKTLGKPWKLIVKFCGNPVILT